MPKKVYLISNNNLDPIPDIKQLFEDENKLNEDRTLSAFKKSASNISHDSANKEEIEEEEKLKEEADAQTAVLEEETKTDTELANNTEEIKNNEEN